MAEHANTREMYDFIATWEPSSVLISRNLVWSRFGILGILGDYVLTHVKDGDILEIGVGESSVFLTRLSEKHKRCVYHCDISGAEITNSLSVDGVLCKCGVVYTGKSDDFFKEVNFSPIALGFIDGDHRYEYVKRDFDNLLPLMTDNGFIFIHDMYPPSEEYLSEHRCGDGYKLRQELERRTDVDIFTFPFGAMGVGLTMVRKLPADQPHYRKKMYSYDHSASLSSSS